MNRFMGSKKVLTSLVIGSSAFLAGSAMAQTTGAVDVSGPLSVLAAVVVAAASIGTAYLGMVFGIRAYKWIKGAA
jgi:hypothetical protein